MTDINQIAWDDTVLPFQLDRSGVRGQGADTGYRLNLGGSWEPDVWGRLLAGVTGAEASAEWSRASSSRWLARVESRVMSRPSSRRSCR